MVIVVFRFVDVVSILILCLYIVSELSLKIIRTLGDVNLHSLHLVNTGIDRTLSFLYRVYFNPSIMNLLNESRVRTVSNHSQIPRA